MSAIDEPLNTTEEQIVDSVNQQMEWPLTVNTTPAALRVIERAIRCELIVLRGKSTPQVDVELSNVANAIRAHLQRIAVEEDPLLK